MKNKLLLPQEIETFYIIPTLRRYLALDMKARGMKQKDIAHLLMVNSAAISQYTSSKRGNKLNFDPTIIEVIHNAAGRIHDHMTYMKEMQHLLHHIRQSNTLCGVHKQLSDIPEHCSPEEVGCHIQGRCC